MSFQNALKYAIHQKRFEIRKKLALTAAEAESAKNNDEAENSESNNKA